MSSSSRPWTNCASSIRPWPLASCRRPVMSIEHTAPTVVASVQTLSRRARLARLVPDFQTIVIDEAHHAPAPTYRRILEYCRAWHPDGPLVVGVTATPERGDRHSLRQVFDGIVY